MSTENKRMLQRKDTAANWTLNNPVLGDGEFGLETDTRSLKVGDGSTVWNSLGYSLKKFFDGSKSYDFGSVADGAQATTTVTVTGAKLGDFAEVSFSLGFSGMFKSADVTADDTVTIVILNKTGSPIDLAAGTLYARVHKR